ncbi:MAG TPA: alpha/beta fold hydrolase [Thermoanaerobaculia bacterium]|nr:alpha/beta fold hydrolase [Thermoanaerobaculia bacterium]
MQIEELTVTARDGYALAARLLLPDEPPARALVLNPALGVPKEFYRRFAERATELGYAVLLYDYRGIAGSRRGSLRGFDATFRDYGILDIAAAIESLAARFPNLPKHALGHSAGGQLLGLAHNHGQLERVIMVACSTGTIPLMPRPFRYLARFMMHVFIPLTTALLGYAPAKAVRWGEDLPREVAREWADWCKAERYLASYFGRTITRHWYDEVRIPILAVGITDDPIANRRSIPALLSIYANAPKEVRWLQPSDAGAKQLGHLGFFTSKGRALWDDVLR